MKLKIAMLLAVSVAVTGSALAAEPGAFVGASYGTTDWELAAQDIQAVDPTITNLTLDSEDKGWKLWGGYQFKRWLAIEGGYANLGEYDLSGTANGMGSINSGSFDGRLDVTTFFADLELALPLGRMFVIFIKGGAHRWSADVNVQDASGLLPSDETDGIELTYGGGVELNFRGGFGIRVEWERFENVGDRSLDFTSGGLLWRF